MELKLGAGNEGTVQASDAVFGSEYNEALVHQVVMAYMAAARSGTRGQKTRAEVSGGGQKPWRQKGTGRARAGTSRGPLWRGGGVTFAATPRDYSQKVNKKMYRGAMRAILSELARLNRLVVVEDFAVPAPKTKQLAEKLKGLNVNDVLIVTEEVDENLFLSARNMHNVGVCDVAAVDPVSLVGFENVVMTVGAVRRFEEWLG